MSLNSYQSVLSFWNAPSSALFPRATVAAALHHTVRWLAQQEARGCIPNRVRVGRLWLYRKEDVLRYWGISEVEVRHE